MIATEFRKILKQFGLEWFNRYYACYKGFVADNADPDFLGRIKVRVPQIYGTTVLNYWAWSKGMFSGNQIGLFAIPNVGDAVWVSFENGDAEFPIWEYGWYASGEVPNAAKVDGDNPKNMLLQSTVGHRIELDDHNELIRITDKHGHVIELNKNGTSIKSNKISLGSLDKSAEPAILGDKAVKLLNEFITDLGLLAGIVVSPAFITGTLNTSPQWSILAAKWQAKWESIKSSKVTLD